MGGELVFSDVDVVIIPRADKEKQVTGLTKLTPEELKNLNDFLDTDKVLAADPLFPTVPLRGN